MRLTLTHPVAIAAPDNGIHLKCHFVFVQDRRDVVIHVRSPRKRVGEPSKLSHMFRSYTSDHAVSARRFTNF